MKGFDHKAIEESVRKQWEDQQLYVADLSDTQKEKYYLLFEFPYPSGDLHTGHWYAYAMPDIFARYLRMTGKNVLFPVGFDAFGLPAENAAIKRGLDPKQWTYDNMDRMREQLKSMGGSFDWSKEVISCDPAYYKWTQWLFTKFYENNLVERREAAVKWCPKDLTVLANEQVIDGGCERCGTPVEEKRLTQWFMKITNYADRLLSDLDPLPWREDIKEAQRAWIGKSEGASISFSIADRSEVIEVFTTRPDTLYGATYVVLAPEHPLVDSLLDAVTNGAEVTAYVEQTKRKTERERSENKEKTGVPLAGIEAINPATLERIPVYIADYALASYGTGAVMAVPAHDERDYEFAQKMQLPIRRVIEPLTGTPQENPEDKQKIVAIVEHEGKVLTINWKPELGGRLTIGGTAEAGEDPAVTAKREIAEETGYTDLELVETAEEKVHHEYFAHSKGKAFIAHTTLLHFRLKSDAHIEPALEEDEKGKFTVEWVSIEQARQEIKDPLHTYALERFLVGKAYTGDGILTNSGEFTGRGNREALWDIVDATNSTRTENYRLRDWLVSRQRYWGCPIPVVYDPEGKPHAIPSEHLPWLLPTDVDFTPNGKAPLSTSKELHERVTKIFGEGWTPEYDTLDTFVDSSWYFLRYLDPKDEDDFSDPKMLKHWLPIDRYSGGSEHTTMHLLYSRFFHKALYDMALVPTPEPFNERFNRGIILGTDGQKMSKSKGNVLNPDEFVQKYGSDTVRLYLAFIGPYNEPGSYPWSMDGVEAMRRFLDRIHALRERIADTPDTVEVQRALAKATKKVGEDIHKFKFNTAISALMILMKELEAHKELSKDAYLTLLRLVAPFAPHLTDHLYQEISETTTSIHTTAWPEVDAALAEDEVVTMAVQVNGKKRGEITIPKTASEEEALTEALKVPAVVQALTMLRPKKVIYVPGRILNLIPS